VESTLALELLAKLQRFGKDDARVLEDVARRIRAASSGKKGGSVVKNVMSVRVMDYGWSS
jgi:hypothetical protein